MLTRKCTSSSTKSKFSVHPAFPVVWAILLLLGKEDGAFSAFIAALIHEVAHIAAFLSYGQKIKTIKLMPFGVSVSLCSATDVSCLREIVSSLAGIAVNLAVGATLVVLGHGGIIRRADFFAACNFALAAVNTVPVVPLDGGRALYFLLLSKLSVRKAGRVSAIVSFVFLIPLTVFSICLVLKTGYNFSLLLICIYLFSYIAFKKEI